MNIMLKDTKYTRTVRALRNFVMTVLPLFFLALTGCRNEEDIPERLSGEDDVTVRLIRPTGIKPAHCFPKPPHSPE